MTVPYPYPYPSHPMPVPTNRYMTREELRLEALRLAQQYSSENSSPEEIVERARVYLEWLAADRHEAATRA